ncbi:sugar (and other) transporter family protein [Paraburkholderia xenovorans LB400]|uniref:Major facilitator superfamily (MFS) transporter n=1 Tax=Paraburkholderia xenovorans (strain LB400) TaxID=266265 RepID=Q13J53_PARXL|nr:MFS transporter [Paraburkholderia xenovorans]ABE35886.1 major facilitator superfamily (MFS) transporter [Paraburkholderia xenovorans LB400]AIP35421.1 sugar (and other) transporter family protein [Paraburkholderia xenovorans LB400]
MNRSRLFMASCISMLTTALVFAIRGDIEAPLRAAFHLSGEQMGLIWGPAFFGFTASIFLSSFVIDLIGMRRLYLLSGFGFLASLVIIVLAPYPVVHADSIFAHLGTTMLYVGFLVMGLSQGLVEGVVNPLVSSIYNDQKTTRLNALHAWWPAGMIVGGLAALGLTQFHAIWQVKLAVVAVPTLTYMAMSWNQSFPPTERAASEVPTNEMLRETVNPLFLVLFCFMWLTAITELGADQWFPSMMKQLTGLDGILFLVYTAGLVFTMRTAVGRYVHRSPFFALTLCSALCAAGLWMLGSLHPGDSVLAAFAAATLFGVGKSLFWPTMLGITSERFPRGGPLCLGLMGGGGFLSIAVALPIIGRNLDQLGPNGAIRALAVLPAALVIGFMAIYMLFKLRGGYTAILLRPVEAQD